MTLVHACVRFLRFTIASTMLWHRAATGLACLLPAVREKNARHPLTA
jgi:hypothetical protein